MLRNSCTVPFLFCCYVGHNFLLSNSGEYLFINISVAILLFNWVLRCLRLTVRAMELTVSNLRVPMFAHAGDSDEEEEDRAGLVAPVEDSDQEENDRRETKRRNYLLLRERASVRRGEWGIEAIFSSFFCVYLYIQREILRKRKC